VEVYWYSASGKRKRLSFFPKVMTEKTIPAMLQVVANGMNRVAKSNIIVATSKYTTNTYREWDLSLIRRQE